MKLYKSPTSPNLLKVSNSMMTSQKGIIQLFKKKKIILKSGHCVFKHPFPNKLKPQPMLKSGGGINMCTVFQCLWGVLKRCLKGTG